jgi:hypothetical protein
LIYIKEAGITSIFFKELSHALVMEISYRLAWTARPHHPEPSGGEGTPKKR